MRYISVCLISAIIVFFIIKTAPAHAGALSSSLSGKEISTTGAPKSTLRFNEDSLLYEIEGKISQAQIYEQSVMMDFESISKDLADYTQSPEAIEQNYRQLLILLNISIGSPYEERMYYNQLFEIDSNLKKSINHYKTHAETIASNITLLKEAKKELQLLPDKTLALYFSESTSNYISKLTKIIRLLDRNHRLVQSRLADLTKLQNKINTGLDRINKEIPELFISYLWKLRIPIYKYEVIKRAVLAPSFWLQGQPSQALSKMPNNIKEVVWTAVFPTIFLLFFLVSTRKLHLNFIYSIISANSDSKKNLLQLWVLFPLSCGFFAAAQFIDFPSNILPFKIGELLFYLIAIKMAWCFRILKIRNMPATPFYPLYWLFVLGSIAQFMHIPLVMMSVLWPISILIVILAMYKIHKRQYPALEKNIIKYSIWVAIVLVFISIEGHVYLAILLSMGLFICAVSVQLGVAISILLKEKTENCFYSKSGVIKGTLVSLTIPAVWLFISTAIITWIACQFGELNLFFKILDNTQIISTSIILFITLLSLRFLTSCELAHSTLDVSGRRPLKGFIQVSKFLLFIFGLGTAICFSMGRSPWALLGGLGAVAAALLLIFKDTILALVAGVRIIIDDLVRINDWIEIKSLDVDGNVVDVSLHCVKIQNFDRTIVTIPTTTLTKNSFKNWRGMTESGGRRIKRSIPIDLSSITFLDEKQILKLKKIDLLKEWFKDNAANLDISSSQDLPLKVDELEGPTNLGAFRAYIEGWIKANKNVHKGLTLLIRHLAPEPDKGLPLEIYVFSNDTNWNQYEYIQADIFDHLLAVIPLFGLRIYQRNALFDNRRNKIFLPEE